MHKEIQEITKYFVLIIFIIIFHVDSVAGQLYCVEEKAISSRKVNDFNELRINKNMVEDKYVIVSNKKTPGYKEPELVERSEKNLSFEIVNMQENKTLQCTYDNTFTHYSDSCLLSSTTPLIVDKNRLYHYELSNHEDFAPEDVMSWVKRPMRKLELKQKIDNVCNNDEAIIKIDCTKDYVITVTSQGSVAKFPINNNEIVSKDKQKWSHPTINSDDVVSCIALDKQKNILFLGFQKGKVGYCNLNNKDNIKIFDVNCRVDCIDVYKNKLVFGGDKTYGTLDVKDLLEKNISDNNVIYSSDEQSNIIDLFWLVDNRLFVETENEHCIIKYNEGKNTTISDCEKIRTSSCSQAREGRKYTTFLPLDNRTGFYIVQLGGGMPYGFFRYVRGIKKYVIPTSLPQTIKVIMQSTWLKYSYVCSAAFASVVMIILIRHFNIIGKCF